MNWQLIATLATRIKSEDLLARKHAETAVEHAKNAGRLLIEAKQAVPHGQWLAWLDEHCRVSPRQAQRYMQAANGKPLPIRQIAKSDTVSYSPGWQPPRGVRILSTDGAGARWLIEPVDCTGDFVFVSRVSPDLEHVDYTKRGIRRDMTSVALQCLATQADAAPIDPGCVDWSIVGYGSVVRPQESLGEHE